MRTISIVAAALVAAILAASGNATAASSEPSRADDENAIRLNIGALAKAANAHKLTRTTYPYTTAHRNDQGLPILGYKK